MPDGFSLLLDVVASRGLSLRVRPDGTPYLRGPAEEVTPALRDMLALWREEAVAVAERDADGPPAPRLREWRWPSRVPADGPIEFGRTVVEEDASFASAGDPEQHPCGAAWWRWAGEQAWRAIPGRDQDYFRSLRLAEERGADWVPEEARA